MVQYKHLALQLYSSLFRFSYLRMEPRLALSSSRWFILVVFVNQR